MTDSANGMLGWANVDSASTTEFRNTSKANRVVFISDLHDFVLVLAKQKPKSKLFVLTGQNTIAKQKKFCFGCAQNKKKHKIVQVRFILLP